MVDRTELSLISQRLNLLKAANILIGGGYPTISTDLDALFNFIFLYYEKLLKTKLVNSFKISLNTSTKEKGMHPFDHSFN